ncbi:MAG TPA: DUF624 domain-containing protein, partial [Bacillales bacterium]|nr:DUF624 domain-containing protein [Bacillales bacterium]
MVGTKWQNTLIVVMEWLTRLAYINILWLLFTLAGLVVFGFGPATNAMFALMRKWLLYPEEDVPVWKTFYRIYRSEFVRSNVLTSIVFLLGVILYFDQAYFGASEKIWFQLAVFVVWGLGLAFV